MKILFSFLLVCTLACSAENVTFKASPIENGIFQATQYAMLTEDEKHIGSMSIIKGTSLAIFKSDAFASIDKASLPSEIAEIITLAEAATDLENTVVLGDLYVSSAYRGKGYAKKFTEHVCQEIHKQGIHKIVLIPHPFTYENNIQKSLKGCAHFEDDKKRLIKLYQSCGFEAAQYKDLHYMYKISA